MLVLPKPLQEEKFSYSSSKTKSDLAQDISKLFSGKFNSYDEFYVTDTKSSPFFFDNGSSGHNSLKGKISAQDGKVIIDLIVKPVPRIYVLIFAPVLFGLAYLCYRIFSSTNISLAALLYSMIFILLIPITVLFSGQASKDKLRKRFVDVLNLNKI